MPQGQATGRQVCVPLLTPVLGDLPDLRVVAGARRLDDAEAFDEAVLAGLPLEGEQRAQLVFAEAGGIVQLVAGGRQGVPEAGRAVVRFEVTGEALHQGEELDRKSTRLNSSH